MTLHSLLQIGAAQCIAIAASERRHLSYESLRRLVDNTVVALNQFGIRRNERVAIVLPNGPEMATAFVAIACGATTAPLNPGYQKSEFDFYLSDLDAKALVVETGSDTPAIAAAQDRGIPVIRLRADPSIAGEFTLEAPGELEVDATVDTPVFAQQSDVALVLHTSGTTSRPKIVPLTHGNVCASAANIRTTLNLTADDRCLNVMPLFHIHGLMAAVVASLSAGASVFCAPGFNALRFFAWLSQAAPTWYTAVPTMHQAILARASRNSAVIENNALRFIRSSSSSLPPQVMRALEETFDAPVIEAYAMTEAAHQMTSDPLPPAERKPGSVGIAAGPEVSVMD